MASLIIVAGKSRGHFFHVEPPKIVVGRDEGCDIQVIDELVSRRHFEVRCEEGSDRYELVDLKSSNGTFVNRDRVSEHRLGSGDQVQLGRTLLLYTGLYETLGSYELACAKWDFDIGCYYNLFELMKKEVILTFHCVV